MDLETLKVLEANAAADSKSSLRHYHLGLAAVQLKKTCRYGEWMSCLLANELDQNRINRAMRFSKYLSDEQCQVLPVLVAEQLVKLIRKNPARNMEVLTEEAWAEYREYRKGRWVC